MNSSEIGKGNYGHSREVGIMVIMLFYNYNNKSNGGRGGGRDVLPTGCSAACCLPQ